MILMRVFEKDICEDIRVIPFGPALKKCLILFRCHSGTLLLVQLASWLLPYPLQINATIVIAVVAKGALACFMTAA